MKILINKKRFLNLNLGKQILMLLAFILISTAITKAETGRFRLTFAGNPSTEVTLGFDAYATGTNPIIYYSTSYIDINNLSLYTKKIPDSIVDELKQYPLSPGLDMVICLAVLQNLTPGQVYYFVVKDNNSVSEVYNFETISDSPNTKLSILAGGDSRNNDDVKRTANKIISKLNAHAMLFDGDFTNNGKAPDWHLWLDEWELTFSSTNRITPLIPARGNHESNNAILTKLFGINTNNYYSTSLGGNLLRVYTLNSETAVNGYGQQTNWLESDLISNSNSIWKFAQYHRPIRPHTIGKLEGGPQYAYWANLFYQNGVDAVLEGDAHTVKTTWPLIPCSGGFDCDEGFKRDDINGTVYLGEGSISAPLRPADDLKQWTRDSGVFNQFKWMFVDKNKMEVRTVKYDVNTNTDIINELPATNRFTVPQNLEIWNPSNGDVVTLNKPTVNIPTCTLTSPYDNEMYFNLNSITLSALANGTLPIAEVQFYVDGTLIGTDNNAPYELNWQPSSNGDYIISTIAQNVNGLSSSMDFSVINVGSKNNIEHCASIDISSDEYAEYKNKISYNQNHLEIAKSTNNSFYNYLQGLRFKEINIPPNATIHSANISFISTGSYTNVANSTIHCEKSGNGLPFQAEGKNISDRVKTDNSFEWTIPNWINESVEITPNLSNIIQELVQLPDWTIESPVVFLMTSNTGTRRAKSYTSLQGNNDKSASPKLTVQFSIPNCPATTCNDGNPNTINDGYDQYCRCIGELLGCTDANACNYSSHADVADNSCIYPASPCDDGDPNTFNDILKNDCVCMGDDSCPIDIEHNGNLTGGNYTVSNSILSSAIIDENQRVDYDAGGYIHLDKGFLADSNADVYLLAKIEGCSQLRVGNFVEQINSIKNYPNPFTGQTTIQFEVNSTNTVSLIVTDVTGKVVAELLNETLTNKGQHQIRFNGSHLAQGIYYCTLIANDKVTTQKMMLMK